MPKITPFLLKNCKNSAAAVVMDIKITANYDVIHYVCNFETICVLENLAKGAPNFISGREGGSRMALIGSGYCNNVIEAFQCSVSY